MEPEWSGTRRGSRGRAMGNERTRTYQDARVQNKHPTSRPCHERMARSAIRTAPSSIFLHLPSTEKKLPSRQIRTATPRLSFRVDSSRPHRRCGVFSSWHRHPTSFHHVRWREAKRRTSQRTDDVAVSTPGPCKPQTRARMRHQAERSVGRTMPNIASEGDRCYAQEAE